MAKDDKGLILCAGKSPSFLFGIYACICGQYEGWSCALDGFRTERLVLIAFGAWKQRYVLTPKLSLYLRPCTVWWRVMAWLLLVLNAMAKDDKALLLCAG